MTIVWEDKKLDSSDLHTKWNVGLYRRCVSMSHSRDGEMQWQQGDRQSRWQARLRFKYVYMMGGKTKMYLLYIKLSDRGFNMITLTSVLGTI